MKDQQNLDHYEPSKFKVSVLFIYLFLLKKNQKFLIKILLCFKNKTRLGHDLMHYSQQIFIILQGSISILLNLSYY